MAKDNITNAKRVAIDKAHNKDSKPTVGLWQQGQKKVTALDLLSIKL